MNRLLSLFVPHSIDPIPRVDYEKKNRTQLTRFPYDVAFGELCRIKGEALGPVKPLGTHWYEFYKMVK